MKTALLLDSTIRDWVLLPILLIVMLTSVLRGNITRLLGGSKPGSQFDVTQKRTLLQRMVALRTNCGVLSESSFLRRRVFFADPENGVVVALVKEAEAAKKANPMAGNPAMDPSAMTDMMKKQMVMVVPQIALMSWISFFFTGFVLLKFPFPLTMSFKTMLQRDVDLDTLDASYVSSVSWYFLNVMGLRGLLFVLFGENNVINDADVLKSQMNAGAAAAPGQQVDYTPLLGGEKENLDLTQYKSVVDGATERLARLWSDAGAKRPELKKEE